MPGFSRSSTGASRCFNKNMFFWAVFEATESVRRATAWSADVVSLTELLPKIAAEWGEQQVAVTLPPYSSGALTSGHVFTDYTFNSKPLSRVIHVGLPGKYFHVSKYIT